MSANIQINSYIRVIRTIICLRGGWPHPYWRWPLPQPLPRREGRCMWGYPYKSANTRIERSVHPCYRGISVITPLPLGEGKGEGPTGSWYVRLPLLGYLHEAWWGLSLTLDRFISHRAHRVHGVFWRTVSSPQKASGIQSSQSVTAKGGCKVLWNRLT